jgi:cytochrome c-type biogenesis protein CcmH/NrfG
LAAQERVGSNDALLLAQLARCEVELGNVGEALPLAARAYRLLPGNATISGVYGITVARGGGLMTDARDLLDKAVQLAPEDALLRQWRAEVWESAG